MNAEEAFKKDIFSTCRTLRECLDLNQISPNLGVNSMLFITISTCVESKVKKAVMLKTFSDYWDDIEEQMKEQDE